MVNPAPPIWILHGILERIRRIIHHPADIWLAIQIGYFLYVIPKRMEQLSLPSLLAELAGLPRPPAPNVAAGVERIARLRGLWLRRTHFRSSNTCYLRALVLYRFLDTKGHKLCIHYGIESRKGATAPNGHAWITVDGVPWEAPEPTRAGLVRDIFVFP